MQKLYRNILAGGLVALGLAACGDKVTVTQPGQHTGNVNSVTVTPPSLTVPLNTADAKLFTVSVSADSGTSTAVDWSSSVTTVATIGADGTVHVVGVGQTTISAKSHVDASKGGAASLTVTAANTASISINTVNTGATGGVGGCPGTPGLPVLLSNVACQIDIGLNLSAGGQSLDSGAVYITPPTAQTCTALGTTATPAAKQSFGNTIPSTGFINLSVNTANYGKNRATASDTVYFTNGQRNIIACLFAPGGASAAVLNTNNTVAINLVNVDGWAADIIGDTFLGSSPAPGSLPTSALGANGLTYWGGPSATGKDSVIYYPIIFTQGRSVAAASFGEGPGGAAGCSVSALTNVVGAVAIAGTTRQVNKGFARSFGYTAAPQSATTACTTYENTGGAAGPRDNVLVTLATDNFTNPFPGVNAAEGIKLIANVVTFGSTPDSLRFDFKGPTVPAPAITRSLVTEHAQTGWVNAPFSFLNWVSTDAGVGINSGTLAARFAAAQAKMTYSAAATATSVGCVAAVTNNGNAANPMATGTGADIPECPILVNSLGGAIPTAAGTAPFTVKAIETDRLANSTTSASSASFGVDKTTPLIRWGLVGDQAADPQAVNLVGLEVNGAAGGVSSLGTDDTLFTTKPTTQAFRAEFNDDRSGFIPFSVGSSAAYLQFLETAGQVNNLGLCVGTPATDPLTAIVPQPVIGASFVTAPNCVLALPTAGQIQRIDGWQTGQPNPVPQPEGYYFFATKAWDAAGNPSNVLSDRATVNSRVPGTSGVSVPALLTNAVFNIGVTGSDSVELLNVSQAFTYPNLPTVTTARYNQQSTGGAYADNIITSPLVVSMNPATGLPYVRGIEQTTVGGVWSGLGAAPSNVAAAPTNLKPTFVQAWTFNPSNFNSASPNTPIPGLNVQTGVTYNTFNNGPPVNTINPLTNFRVIPTLSVVGNPFLSGVPLRAQAVSPSGTPNSPFARVDFYVLDAGGTWWNYLGSVQTTNVAASNATVSGLIISDDGVNRSWVYQFATADFLKTWNGAAQGAIVTGSTVFAVGVSAAGDGIASQPVTF